MSIFTTKSCFSKAYLTFPSMRGLSNGKLQSFQVLKKGWKRYYFNFI